MKKLTLTSLMALGLGLGAAVAQTQAPSTDPTVVPRVGDAPGSIVTPGGSAAETMRWRSYRSLDEGARPGATIQGMSVNEMIGKDVVDSRGREVGEVADLVIDSDNTVRQVLIEVGGFLGLGERTVALDIAQLRPAGNGRDELVTTMTEEQLKSLPELRLDDSGWYTRRES
jgi:hypothetical protein